MKVEVIEKETGRTNKFMSFAIQFYMLGEAYNENSFPEDEIHHLYHIVELKLMQWTSCDEFIIAMSIPFYAQKYPEKGKHKVFYFCEGIVSHLRRQDQDTDLYIHIPLDQKSLSARELQEGLIERIAVAGFAGFTGLDDQLRRRWNDWHDFRY